MSLRNFGPIVLIVLGVLITGVSLWWPTQSNDELLSMPVSLAYDAERRSEAFLSEGAGHVLIELEVERALPFEELVCLLGTQGLSIPCAKPSPLRLNWTVLANGAEAAKGSSDQRYDGVWGDKVARTIGEFDVVEGQSYQLVVESLKDATAIMTAQPRVVVRTHPMASKGIAVASQVGATLGLLLLGGGVAWLVWTTRKSATESQVKPTP